MTYEPPEADAPRPSRRFQVLALDGGGYKGLFSAALLGALEEDYGVSVVDCFDLVAGTSTGGIIALGLGAGLKPRQLVDFYVEEGPKIFRASRLRPIRQLFRSKYDPDPLRKAVDEVFGQRCLWESKVPLCVPAYDLQGDDVYLFRTPHSERLRRDWRERMADIAMATAAAPTFLPAHHLDGLRLVDGGVWANNPAIVAVAEAVSEFGIALGDIRLLSLGTTSDLGVKPEKLDRGGLKQWARAVTPLILHGQSRADENATGHLVGRDRVLRIDPVVPEGVLRLDGVNPTQLMGLARSHSRNRSGDFERIFLGHQPAPYTPCHTPSELQP